MVADFARIMLNSKIELICAISKKKKKEEKMVKFEAKWTLGLCLEGQKL